MVGVVGIVTVVDKNGFFLQDDAPDDDVDTSEAPFVFTAVAPAVKVGDRIRVSGRVGEFYPGRREAWNLPTTQIIRPCIETVARAQELPPPVRIGLGGRSVPTLVIEDDADGFVDVPGVVFDPENDALDFFESLDGMRVGAADAVVVGPLNQFGEMVVLADGGADSQPRSARGALVLIEGDVNPERLVIDDRIVRNPPPANVRDTIDAIVGVLDYRYGQFKIVNTEALALARGSLRPQTATLARDERTLTVASYNVLNLSLVDPSRLNSVAGQIVDGLRSPDIIALQEIQDDSGRRNDGATSGGETFRRLVRAVRERGGPQYAFRQIDPPDGEDGGENGGNIRWGYLFDTVRIQFRDRFDASCFAGSPDLQGRTFARAGRLFADSHAFVRCRKPLLGQFVFRGTSYVVLNVHLSSKRGSASRFGKNQPAPDHTQELRLSQTRALRSIVSKMLSQDPDACIIVLGDFNDFDFTPPLQELTAGASKGRLVNLGGRLPDAERYTYIHSGNGQALDHMLVSPRLAAGAQFEVPHMNAEFAHAVSATIRFGALHVAAGCARRALTGLFDGGADQNRYERPIKI